MTREAGVAAAAAMGAALAAAVAAAAVVVEVAVVVESVAAEAAPDRRCRRAPCPLLQSHIPSRDLRALSWYSEAVAVAEIRSNCW